MWKFLLILFLFFFLLIRLSGFLLRVIFGSAYKKAKEQQARAQANARESQERSRSESKKEVTNKGYTGGEYIDYEEVE